MLAMLLRAGRRDKERQTETETETETETGRERERKRKRDKKKASEIRGERDFMTNIVHLSLSL